MQEMYGNAWVNQFGPADRGTWRRGLNGMTGQNIALALDRAIEVYPDMPPKLGQFRELCKRLISPSYRLVHKPTQRTLTPEQRALGRAELTKLKSLVGRNGERNEAEN